jgi:cell division septation protein DedD
MLVKLDQEETVTADGNTTAAHGTQTASVSEQPSVTTADSQTTTSGSNSPAATPSKPAATPSKPAQTQAAAVPPSSTAPSPPAPASTPPTPAANEPVETAAATPATENEQPGSGTQATQSPVKPGELRLWLGSLPSRSKAESQWTQLRDSYTDLLKDMDMQVGEVERDQRKFDRLLVGPVPDRDRGKEICRTMLERDPQAWCKVVGGP